MILDEAIEAWRIRELERELARKDKALAESAALLVLQKIPSPYGGRGRRHAGEERTLILGLLSEAQAAGARLSWACKVVGLTERTVQRWAAHGGGNDLRRPPV